PLVAAALAARFVAGPLLLFQPVLFLHVRVEMAAGEDDLLAVGPEVGAGRAARPRADAMKDPGLQVHDEDLVERVAASLFFRLEDDLLAVGRKVALTRTDKVVR